MRKTYIAICATAALGLCLMAPKGASAFPAADSAGKAYTQATTGKSAAVPVYLRRGYWGGRVGFRGGIGYRRGYGLGYRRFGVGYGLGYRRFGYGLGWRAAALRRGYGGYYGGLGYGLGYRRFGYGLGYRRFGLGYGLGLGAGWGWPFGFGAGLGAAGAGCGYGHVRFVPPGTSFCTCGWSAYGSSQDCACGYY